MLSYFKNEQLSTFGANSLDMENTRRYSFKFDYEIDSLEVTIKLNTIDMIIGGVTPADFSKHDRDYYIELYLKTIIEQAPQYGEFGVHDLLKSIFKTPEDRNRINEVAEYVQRELERTGVVEKYGTWQYSIIPAKRKEYLNPSIQLPKSGHVNIFNGNVGQFNQESDLGNSNNKFRFNEISADNKNKSIISRIWNFISNNSLISGIILIIITIILIYYGVKL